MAGSVPLAEAWNGADESLAALLVRSRQRFYDRLLGVDYGPEPAGSAIPTSEPVGGDEKL